MRKIPSLVLMLALTTGSIATAAEAPASPDNELKGVSLAHMIERASERLKKNIIVDPRLKGEATLFGIDPERISYRELQAVLMVHGFAIVEDGPVTKVIPDSGIRQYATPLLSDRNSNIGE